MASRYQKEIEAVGRIRDRNPDTPARTLARQINKGDFPMGGENLMDARVCGSTELGEYSRIRRHDAAKRKQCLAA